MKNPLAVLADCFPSLLQYNLFANAKYPARRVLVEALESGKYKQITGQLRTEEGFCVWGVACEEYVRSRLSPRISTGYLPPMFAEYGYGN